MPLTFPTQAEQAKTAFDSATKTISLFTIARRMGAEQIKSQSQTIYIFPDDTSLIVTGSGKRHKITVELP